MCWSVLRSLLPGGSARHNHKHKRKGRACSDVYLDAVDKLPYNAYTCLVGLCYVAFNHASDFGEDAVFKYTGPHSVLMNVVQGMTEIPIVGGLVNLLEIALSRKRPPGLRTRGHNYSVALQQTFVALGCLFIQAALPACMLMQWVREGAHSFNDLFDVPLDVPLEQPAVLLISKSVASAYVLYWIHRKDATCALYLLIMAHHSALNGSPGLFLVAGLTALLYMPAIALAYLVTLVVIARCATPNDVVLSGAGALFILDVDDVLTMTSEQYFDSIKELLTRTEKERAERNAAEDAALNAEAGTCTTTAASTASTLTSCSAPHPSTGDEAAQPLLAHPHHHHHTHSGGPHGVEEAEEEEVMGDEPSDYPLIWLGFLFVLALVSFWLYFLYRLHLHPERQQDTGGGDEPLPEGMDSSLEASLLAAAAGWGSGSGAA